MLMFVQSLLLMCCQNAAYTNILKRARRTPSYNLKDMRMPCQERVNEAYEKEGASYSEGCGDGGGVYCDCDKVNR